MKPSNSSEFDEKSLKEIRVSRDFRLAHPVLVERMQKAIASYKRMFPDRDVIITCTYRSPSEQQRLYKQGRFGNPGNIVTNCDGFQKKSLHNHLPSRAIDCSITDGGKTVWDEALFYPLGMLARECGLEWGGFWKGFVDMPHFQIPKDVE